MFDKRQRGFSVRKLQQVGAWFWPRHPRRRILNCAVAFLILAGGSAIADIYLPNLLPFLNFTGFSATNSTTGSLDVSGPFFQSLGTNGLPMQQYYPGINDSLGGDPHGQQFNPNVFTIYTSWQNSRNPQQASIARGEQIFNTQPLTISDVPGLTTGTQTIAGTCTTCHDTPNVGDHSFPLPLDIGTGHSLQYETDPNIIAGLQQLQQPTLPVFQLVCTQGSEAGQTFYTTDPGKALISGQCSDISRIKGPILRGLAARAPYFHNGAAGNLSQLVNFYNKRFQIGLSPQQMQDLINFLQTL